MQSPDLPHDEPQRLQALHDLKLLDTPLQERQWFKSRQGGEAE